MRFFREVRDGLWTRGREASIIAASRRAWGGDVLQGQFAVVPLEQILRLLNSSRVTGTLQIRAAEGRGAIGFREGAIVDASFARERGLGAFEGLCAADMRDFSLRPITPEDTAIDANIEHLIDRAGELRVAAAEVRRVIPSYRSQILVNQHVAAGAPVTVRKADLRVLGAVDGQRNVAEIARRCHMTRRAALASLYALARDGIVRAGAEQERASAAAPAAVVAPDVALDQRSEVSKAAAGPDALPPSETDPRIRLIRAAMAGSIAPAAGRDAGWSTGAAASAEGTDDAETGGAGADGEGTEPAEDPGDRVSLVFRLDTVAGTAAAGRTGTFVSHYLPVDATVASIVPPVQPKEPGAKTRIFSLFKGRPGEAEAVPDGSSLRARLEVKKGASDGPFELVDREYVVGRSSECDIVLRDPSISRRHIELVPRKGGFAVRDLGSTAGTAVNGAALTAERGLRSGDQLSLGDVVLVFELSPGAGSPR